MMIMIMMMMIMMVMMMMMGIPFRPDQSLGICKKIFLTHHLMSSSICHHNWFSRVLWLSQQTQKFVLENPFLGCPSG